jgi:hypothetical protein
LLLEVAAYHKGSGLDGCRLLWRGKGGALTSEPVGVFVSRNVNVARHELESNTSGGIHLQLQKVISVA